MAKDRKMPRSNSHSLLQGISLSRSLALSFYMYKVYIARFTVHL